MEPLQVALIAAYLFVSFYFFINWLKFFNRIRLSVEDSFLSFVILVIVTMLWPFIVPMSLMQLLTARTPQFSSIVPVVLAIVVVSLITLSGLAAFSTAVPQTLFYLFPNNHLQ